MGLGVSVVVGHTLNPPQQATQALIKMVKCSVGMQRRHENIVGISHPGCLRCGRVYFLSPRLCTYQVAVIQNLPLCLTSSLPPSGLSLCLSSAVYFNKNSRLESESAVVQRLCNCTVRAAREKSSICSNICFSFNGKSSSLQTPALFPGFALFSFGQISGFFL